MGPIPLYQKATLFSGRNTLQVSYLVESRQAYGWSSTAVSEQVWIQLTTRVAAAIHCLLLCEDQGSLPSEQ